jgi:hypothetical protein
MLDSGVTVPAKSRIPAKSIALPVEHGAWGFLFEPLVSGLLIAPTVGGAFLSIFIVGAFLSRQPLKFVIGDRLQKKRLPRTVVATRWMLYFEAIAAIGFAASVFTASPDAFVPLILVSPLVIYLVLQDASRKSRETLPELLAASVLATSIAALSLAAGLGYPFAAAMWLTMVARLIPSVLYVRNRLRLEKGKGHSFAASVASHIAAVVVLCGLYYSGFGSILTVLVAVFLCVRSITGLSSQRKRLTAKQLGVREVIYGVLYALSVVAGFYLKV